MSCWHRAVLFSKFLKLPSIKHLCMRLASSRLSLFCKFLKLPSTSTLGWKRWMSKGTDKQTDQQASWHRNNDRQTNKNNESKGSTYSSCKELQ